MHAAWRIVGLLLLNASVATLPGAQTMPQAVAPVSHVAGCHRHGPMSDGPAIPSPAPVSYQCCVSGHQAALPNVAFSLRFHGALLGNVNDARNLGSDLASNPVPLVFVVPSDSPPITTSLRI